MKTIASVILVVGLAFGSGCTRPDWMEQTLVTVDVTGVWFGILDRGVSTGTQGLWLELQQEGPKVRGSARPEGMVSRSIESAIAGDVFSFKGSSAGAVSGEVTDGEVFIQGVGRRSGAMKTLAVS
jgi:hypothetical protein